MSSVILISQDILSQFDDINYMDIWRQRTSENINERQDNKEVDQVLYWIDPMVDRDWIHKAKEIWKDKIVPNFYNSDMEEVYH